MLIVSTTIFQYSLNSCSNIDTNYSKIKQPCCSVIKQLGDWMTPKMLNSTVNFPLFYPATGN